MAQARRQPLTDSRRLGTMKVKHEIPNECPSPPAKRPKVDGDEPDANQSDARYARAKSLQRLTGGMRRTLKTVCGRIDAMERQIGELFCEQEELRSALMVAASLPPHVAAAADSDSPPPPCRPSNPRNRGTRPFTDAEPLEQLTGMLASSRRQRDGRMVFYALPQNRKMIAMERLRPTNAGGERVLTALHESCRAGSGWFRCRTCRKFNVRVCPLSDTVTCGASEDEHESRCKGIVAAKLAAKDVERMWVAFCRLHRLTAQTGLRTMLSTDATLLRRVAASYYIADAAEVGAKLSHIHLIAAKLYSGARRRNDDGDDDDGGAAGADGQEGLRRTAEVIDAVECEEDGMGWQCADAADYGGDVRDDGATAAARPSVVGRDADGRSDCGSGADDDGDVDVCDDDAAETDARLAG